MNKSNMHQNSQAGFGMIEVLVAVLILGIGFLILAGLQVRLIEGEADARSRTVATRLAADQVEQMRNFMDVSEYLALDSSASAQSIVEENGVVFTREWQVSRHRYNPDPNGDGDRADATFQALDAALNTEELEQQPEFKEVEVSVRWTSSTGRQRQVVTVDSISSAAPKDGVGTLKPDTGSRVKPIVRVYEPDDVGVIPIAVGTDEEGNEVSSSASNPKPTHYAEGTTGTTKFTVQNYISDSSNPLLQRQLDFAYAACSCTLGGTSTETNPAYTPTYWDGVRYVAPKPVVGKPIGAINSGVDQDAQLCEACCRDHHDATGQAIRVDPFRFSSAGGVANYSPSGDHLHFNARNGFSAPAGSGQAYSETCRMVRVDGIYRVATDTRLEDLSILRLQTDADGPYLDDGLSESYAQFTQGLVQAAYQGKSGSYPDGGLPVNKSSVGASYELSADSSYNPAFLDEDRDHELNASKNTKQYFAARGIYIDWISPKAQERINCIGSSTDACLPYKNMSLLELVPFVAVNLTDLADWSSTDSTRVSIRNDAIPLVKKGGGSKTEFVRGLASMLADGNAVVKATATRSNSGVVGTQAIDKQDKDESMFDQEEVDVGVLAPPSDKGLFIANIVDNTSDRNFAQQNIKVEMTAPSTLSSPVCTKGGVNTDPFKHQCVFEKSVLEIRMRFSNYNYPTCSHLGNKWVYDTDTSQCLLPPKNKNDTPQYALPEIRDFSMCSLSTPTGALKIVDRVVTNRGTTSEYIEFIIQRNGSATIWDAISGMTNPTFNADFRQTCG